MTTTESVHRAPIDIWPMIEQLKAHVSRWLAEGKIRAGGRVSHLIYFELDSEERKMFHQRLDDFRFPGTSYKLEWNPTVRYFELMPVASA